MLIFLCLQHYWRFLAALQYYWSYCKIVSYFLNNWKISLDEKVFLKSLCFTLYNFHQKNRREKNESADCSKQLTSLLRLLYSFSILMIVISKLEIFILKKFYEKSNSSHLYWLKYETGNSVDKSSGVVIYILLSHLH